VNRSRCHCTGYCCAALKPWLQLKRILVLWSCERWQAIPVFACESKKDKQKWLSKCVLQEHSDACLFNDVSVQSLKGTCVNKQHRTDLCDPGPVDVFISGFSCKNFSQLNSSGDYSKLLLEPPQEASAKYVNASGSHDKTHVRTYF
jgi:hypothetical protein